MGTRVELAPHDARSVKLVEELFAVVATHGWHQRRVLLALHMRREQHRANAQHGWWLAVYELFPALACSLVGMFFLLLFGCASALLIACMGIYAIAGPFMQDGLGVCLCVTTVGSLVTAAVLLHDIQFWDRTTLAAYQQRPDHIPVPPEGALMIEQIQMLIPESKLWVEFLAGDPVVGVEFYNEQEPAWFSAPLFVYDARGKMIKPQDL